MRLLIVEDVPATLEALKILLGGETGITVVGAFPSAEDALDVLEKLRPEIMLVDLGLPGKSGIELIAEAKAQLPGVAVLVYTVFDDWVNVFAALKAGASGYVLKGSKPRELVEAITGLHEGGAPMSPRIARMVIEDYHGAAGGATQSLTDRELDVLRTMEQGLGYKEIADRLGVSPHTVRTHIRNIYEKLHAKNKLDALRRARHDRLF